MSSTEVAPAATETPAPTARASIVDLVKRHFDSREAKIAKLEAEVKALKEQLKNAKASRTRPARLPKPATA